MPEPVYADEEAIPNDPFRMDPFEQINWKTAAAREEWAELHQQMSAAKRFAEWYSVLDDECDRDAAIIHVNNYNREKWIKRVGKYGLSYRDIRYSEPYDGFSHKFFPTDEDNPNRITYAVIAETDEVAEEMKEAELNGGTYERHEVVGSHLGFPDCCRNFFNDEWVGPEDGRGRIDPMYEITCNSDNATRVGGDPHTLRVEDPNPGANVLWRYFGWSFVTHLPCSWNCEGSVEIARNRYRIMMENGYEDAAKGLYKWLSTPHVWSGYHGLCNVKNRYVTTASSTSSYWDEKEVIWGQRNAPGGATAGEDSC